MSAQAEPDWKSCSSTAPWVANSLKARAEDLRLSAVILRKRHAGRFYAKPADFLADIYDEAASVLEREIASLVATSTYEGDTK